MGRTRVIRKLKGAGKIWTVMRHSEGPLAQLQAGMPTTAVPFVPISCPDTKESKFKIYKSKSHLMKTFHDSDYYPKASECCKKLQGF
jgi:hypothetical protein